MSVYILQLPLPIYNAANKIYTNEKQKSANTKKKKKKKKAEIRRCKKNFKNP